MSQAKINIRSTSAPRNMAQKPVVMSLNAKQNGIENSQKAHIQQPALNQITNTTQPAKFFDNKTQFADLMKAPQPVHLENAQISASNVPQEKQMQFTSILNAQRDGEIKDAKAQFSAF